MTLKNNVQTPKHTQQKKKYINLVSLKDQKLRASKDMINKVKRQPTQNEKRICKSRN